MRIILLNLVAFCFVEQGFAQNSNMNIWEIIHTFFINIGMRNNNDYIYPYKDGEYLVLPCSVTGPNGIIIDNPKFEIPVVNELQIYNFGDLNPHMPAYYLLVKKGSIYIINTRKGFRESIAQCVEAFDTLNLRYKEMKNVIQSIVWEYDVTDPSSNIDTKDN